MPLTIETARDHLQTLADSRTHMDVVRLARAAFRCLNSAEGEHITQALQDEAFPFDAAQAELAARFQELARLVRQTLRIDLGSREREQLEELAFLAEGTPLASHATLSSIRAARAAYGLAPG